MFGGSSLPETQHMNIDVHAHYIPGDFIASGARDGDWQVIVRDTDGTPLHAQGLESLGVSDVVSRFSEIDRRLSDMRNQGIDLQVLSVSPGCFNYELEPDLAVELARRYNDSLAESVAKHTGHFVALAQIPMQSPGDAALELERAVRELGLRGAAIGTNIDGLNLDEPRFAPIWAKAQELDVPLFVHPLNPTGKERLRKYYLVNLLGLPTDTALAAASLIFGGVLKEFPRLKFCLAHGGGSCCALWGRWEHGWHQLEPQGGASVAAPRVSIDEPPSHYLGKLFFDSLIHNRALLQFLVDTVGTDRVMLGTDYPFPMGDYDCIGNAASLDISDEAKAQIGGVNAAELFHI
jgi:aminocarboxymuconate-semialdehyde decarboxylase